MLINEYEHAARARAKPQIRTRVLISSGTGTNEHDRIARTAWQQTRNWIAFADHELVADYLYQPKTEHARVAGEAEITSLIEFTTDAEDEPDALLRMAFQNADIPATRLDGARGVDGDFRTPRRFAAAPPPSQTHPASSWPNNTRSTIIVFDDHTIAVAESAVRRWRVPEQIQEMATHAGVNTVPLAALK